MLDKWIVLVYYSNNIRNQTTKAAGAKLRQILTISLSADGCTLIKIIPFLSFFLFSFYSFKQKCGFIPALLLFVPFYETLQIYDCINITIVKFCVM